MTWWAWLLVSFGIGTFAGAFVGFVIALVGRESNERRGGMIDLVGATPHDPDDWFAG